VFPSSRVFGDGAGEFGLTVLKVSKWRGETDELLLASTRGDRRQHLACLLDGLAVIFLLLPLLTLSRQMRRLPAHCRDRAVGLRQGETEAARRGWLPPLLSTLQCRDAASQAHDRTDARALVLPAVYFPSGTKANQFIVAPFQKPPVGHTCWRVSPSYCRYRRLWILVVLSRRSLA
jgi:hypothetical protein